MATKTTTETKSKSGFTADERAAMRERARELKAEAAKADSEKALLAKLAEMPEADRTLGERIHQIVVANAPDLTPKTWYGMPAYARNGKVVAYFKAAHKFGTRYATFGFEEDAHLDDGELWATSFALKTLTPAAEKRIAELVKKAVS